MQDIENSNWLALYTKPRAEKKLAERLKAKGFDVYAPTQTLHKQWSDRIKKVEEPFFKSYVFVRCPEAQKIEVLQTQGAVAFVTWLGKPAQIRNSEIEGIKDFLAAYQGVKIESKEFKLGEELRIKHGRLEDQYGTLIRQSKNKVILEIEQLGMVLKAEIPKSQVELKNE